MIIFKIFLVEIIEMGKAKIMWNVECGMWNEGDFARQNPIIY